MDLKELKLKNQTYLLGLALGFSVLVAYLLTLCPTVAGGDSGELTAAVYTMGTIHPPGYPLYTLLGKAFTFIPYGSVAWRVNFFSAFCNIMAALILFWGLSRWTKRPIVGFFAGALYAFSPLIWRYSVVAEVFGLNNLLVVIFLVFAMESWRELERPFVHIVKVQRMAMMAGLLLGLGMTNHHTFFFVGVPISLYLLFRGRDFLLAPKVLGGILLAIFIGLLPYVYLIFAAKRMPLVSWTDTSTWEGFIGHLLRRDYGTFRLGAMDTQGQLFKGIFLYFKDTPRELLYFLAPLPIYGVYKRIKEEGKASLHWALLFSFFLYLVVFHALANLPLHSKLFYQVHIRFWQLPNIFVFLWTGWGLYHLIQTLQKEKRFLIPHLVFATILFQFATNFAQEDQHENYTTEILGKTVLDIMPNNAVFLSLGDVYTNSIRYLQNCEDYRTDVKVLDRELMKKSWFTKLMKKYHPELNLPGIHYRPNSLDKSPAYHLVKFVEANIGRFPIYAANFKKKGSEAKDKRWQKKYYRLPYGTVHRFFPKSTKLDLSQYVRDTEIILANMKLKRFTNLTEGNWEYLIWKDFKNAPYVRARQLMYLAQSDRNQQLIKQAIPMLEDVTKTHPNPPWESYKLLGAAYNWLTEKKIGHIKRMLHAWNKYFEKAPHDESDRAEIEKSFHVFKKQLEKKLKEIKTGLLDCGQLTCPNSAMFKRHSV